MKELKPKAQAFQAKVEEVMMKLNLGCYDKIRKGYINLDLEKYCEGIDVIHDLNKFPYPFDDNQFEEIYARCVLEHLCPLIMNKVFDELYRITKNNGRIIIIVPHSSSWCNYPIHTRGFNCKGEWEEFDWRRQLKPIKQPKKKFDKVFPDTGK